MLDGEGMARDAARWGERARMGERAFGFWILLLALACAVPIFAFDRLPGADLPAHQAILRHLADAMENPEAFREAMALRPWQPYWGFYGPTLLLARVLPLDLAARVVLYLALMALPGALAVLARRESGDPRVALGAFPVLFGFNWYWGFAPFYISACLAVWGLIPVKGLARSGSGSSLAWTFGTSLALFASHATAWALWASWSLWVLVTEPGRRWRRVLAGASTMGPPLVLFLAWRATAGLEGITQPPASHRLSYKAAQFLHHAFPAVSPTWEALLGLAFVGLLSVGMVPGPRPATAGEGWLRVRWGGLAAAMLGAYWVLPQDVAQISFVYPRFLVFGFAFLLLCLPRDLRFPRGFLAGAIGLGVTSATLAAVGAARFSERAEGARVCLSQAHPGGTLMPFSFQRDDPDLRYPLFLHAGAWYGEMKRGRVFGDWIEALPTAMVFWKDRAGLGTPPPAFLWAPRPLEDPSLADRVDYFLIHGPRKVRPPGGDPVSLDEALLGGISVERPPLCESGRWRLYRRLVPGPHQGSLRGRTEGKAEARGPGPSGESGPFPQTERDVRMEYDEPLPGEVFR